VVFLDESGFMLQPVVRRTWAPRGQTPILRQWDRRDRISTISAITVAPRRPRYGLYWAQYPHNIGGGEVLGFLQSLRRHLPHGFTLIWDRGQPHRAARVKVWLAQRRRLVVEWLPAYAPDLNPVEAVWSHTKHGDLANFAPNDLQDLEQAFLSSMARTKGQKHLLSAFFRAAGLKV
jgi:transposase